MMMIIYLFFLLNYLINFSFVDTNNFNDKIEKLPQKIDGVVSDIIKEVRIVLEEQLNYRDEAIKELQKDNLQLRERVKTLE